MDSVGAVPNPDGMAIPRSLTQDHDSSPLAQAAEYCKWLNLLVSW